jgi:hypothetical protein
MLQKLTIGWYHSTQMHLYFADVHSRIEKLKVLKSSAASNFQ